MSTNLYKLTKRFSIKPHSSTRVACEQAIPYVCVKNLIALQAQRDKEARQKKAKLDKGKANE